MRSPPRFWLGAMLVTATALAPVGCARNETAPAAEPGSASSEPQPAREGPPVVLIIAIGAVVALLLAAAAIEDSGVGMSTPPPGM
jgi:hypothetical protein